MSSPAVPASARRRTGGWKRWTLQAVLATLAVITLIPFAWLLIASLKSGEDFFGAIFFPPGEGPLGIGWDRLTLDNYRKLFAEGFGRAFLNSVFYASTTAVLGTLVCSASGYALAKFRFRGRGPALIAVLSLIILPPTLLIAPGYELLYHIGLLDTVAGLILPVVAPAFGVFLFRQAITQAVPDQLIEAARMDGCSEIEIYFSVVLPLIRPMVGAFLLISFLAMWNNFISPQIVLQSQDKQPLSVAIAQLRGIYRTDYGLLMAATVVSIAPVALLFLLLQKQFISGLTSGAVKG
ncbi:MAG: carbohydrate ABC transporter permease [Phycisphaerales bacterium]|nr:carbohydrate ABC transporter permease [Planctomycetota bacterium]MCH8507700.1 carbohydrate ABC transporter permease [Phycisphaerales bacterium]